MKKILFLALVLLAPAASAYDEVCGDSCMDKNGTLPTCEELGYSQNRFCPEGYITCPFDESYIWCKQYSCDVGGFVSADAVESHRAQGYLCQKTRFHGLTCYDCDNVDKSVCIYDQTNKGEGTLSGTRCADGSYTECTKACAAKDKSASLPQVAGVIPIYQSCMSCGVKETIVTGFECAENYVKNNNTCEPTGCPRPSNYTDILYTASDMTDCSAKAHPEGWLFEQKGKSGGKNCSRCVPKACPLGFEAKLATCPNETGYSYERNGYSGDDVCGYCNDLKCIAPYSDRYQKIDNCPKVENADWTIAKAWTYSQSPSMSGDRICGLCEPKACVGGYSQIYQSINDCPNTVGYTWEYDKNHFYGNKYCGRCVAKACTQGKPQLALSDCLSTYGYASVVGASVEVTDEYVGTDQCKVCTCHPEKTCLYTSANIGDSGEGVTPCCDGNSYMECRKKASCDGVEADSIKNAKATSACSACGHTYLKVTACEEGFKPSDDQKMCVQKTCEDYGLKSSRTECNEANGYIAEASSEHSGCFSCVAKTCETWGDDVGQVWHLYNSSSKCESGYELTRHSVKISGAPQYCYDCESCSSQNGYIAIEKETDVPEEVTDKNIVKSCGKYQYCATSCAKGYTLSGCSCVEAACSGYSEHTGLSKLDETTYTDGVHNYGICQKGASILYKISGCADGYSDVSSCGGIGETRQGSTKSGYACYKCSCTSADLETCPYSDVIMGKGETYIGRGGRGVDICCNGRSYQHCEKDETKCPWTLTAKPENATSTETCTACGVTYHHVIKCNTGYQGETCSDCAEGYIRCNDKCLKQPTCEHGMPVCGDSKWECSCQTGYKGSSCQECATGYQECNGNCYATSSCGAHGKFQCTASGVECGCATGYTGEKCNICADGYHDYGAGCVLIESCENGNFNGTECVCDSCYEQDSSGKCTKLSSKCYNTGGQTKPKSCAEPYGYSESCDPNCENCVARDVETTTGTLHCFEKKPKECSSFCGYYDLTSGAKSVSDSARCSSLPAAYSYGVYSWLSNDVSGKSVSYCGTTCYFDDKTCSKGERLTDEQKSARESSGDVCTLVGRTGAGTGCYDCVSNLCADNLTHESDVAQAQANGFVCTLKAGKETASGASCYECLNDVCENGTAYSAEDVDAKARQYAFARSTRPSCANDYSYDFVSRTQAGSYCYINFSPTDCAAVTSNDLYASAGACVSAISTMTDFNKYVMADCHACVDSSTGVKLVRWYPACLMSYADEPQNSQNGVRYQNGENCCQTSSENTLGEDVYTPVYTSKLINLRTYKLGTSVEAQTCYATDKTCELVEEGYCGGTKCVEVNCEGYPYNYTNKPQHADLSGNSCRTMSVTCQGSDIVQYEDFQCHTNYVRTQDGTCELSCDEQKGAYATQPAGSVGLWQDDCFYPTNCADGYLTEDDAGSIFELASEGSTFMVNNGQSSKTCYQVKGCQDGKATDIATWNSKGYANIFKSASYPSGSVQCLVPTGCASDKDGYKKGTTYTCSPKGLTLQNTTTLGDWTCGECLGCVECSAFISGTTSLQNAPCAEGYIDTTESKRLCTNSSELTNCHKCTLPAACQIADSAALYATKSECETAVGANGSCNYCAFGGTLYVEPVCAQGFAYDTVEDTCKKL
ncbi:MAG: hypothetical protein IJ870_00280 [Alphaproteobacteria bacterium]|nr:hypothetical protein [Alphaproteobacteria bacterium]